MLRPVFYQFVALSAVLDPIGTAAIFISLTGGAALEHRRRMACHSVIIAAIILVGFMIAGKVILQVLGVGLPAFRIAGGCLLFLVAVDMLRAGHGGLRQLTDTESREAGASADITVFPLAIPLIAGPGAMTTVLLLTERYNDSALDIVVLIAVLGAALGAMLLSLLAAARLVGYLGTTGVNVVSRVLGILLATIAAQLVLDGITTGLRLGELSAMAG